MGPGPKPSYRQFWELFSANGLIFWRNTKIPTIVPMLGWPGRVWNFTKNLWQKFDNRKTQNPLFCPCCGTQAMALSTGQQGSQGGWWEAPFAFQEDLLGWKGTFHPRRSSSRSLKGSFEQLLWAGTWTKFAGRLASSVHGCCPPSGRQKYRFFKNLGNGFAWSAKYSQIPGDYF